MSISSGGLRTPAAELGSSPGTQEGFNLRSGPSETCLLLWPEVLNLVEEGTVFHIVFRMCFHRQLTI